MKVRFEAALIEGHKGALAVIVPFDPGTVFKAKPTALDERREGWLVSGTANGKKFDGYVGYRWGRFFILLDRALGIAPGEPVTMIVQPSKSARVLDKAREQSQITTAPSARKKRPPRK